jgi:hypothetical protein
MPPRGLQSNPSYRRYRRNHHLPACDIKLIIETCRERPGCLLSARPAEDNRSWPDPLPTGTAICRVGCSWRCFVTLQLLFRGHIALQHGRGAETEAAIDARPELRPAQFGSDTLDTLAQASISRF